MSMSSADTGSGQTGVNLSAHVTGNPIPGGGAGAGANVTVGHTVLLILGALALLWLFGGVLFKSIRMH
jgi:hypothetical protein